MGANVIALDPSNLGMFALKTLLQRFSKQNTATANRRVLRL